MHFIAKLAFAAAVGVLRANTASEHAAADTGLPAPAIRDIGLKELSKKVMYHLREPQYLHMTCKIKSDRGFVDVRSWMHGAKIMTEVRRTDTQKSADFAFVVDPDAGRISEYSPKARFVNGTEATDVIMSYACGPEGLDWSRLAEQTFACEFGLASTSWQNNNRHSSLDSIGLVISDGNSLEVKEVDGRSVYAVERTTEDGAVIHRLRIDKDTYELLWWETSEPKRDVPRTRTVDFEFEHFRNDPGWNWALDAAKLSGKK